MIARANIEFLVRFLAFRDFVVSSSEVLSSVFGQPSNLSAGKWKNKKKPKIIKNQVANLRYLSFRADFRTEVSLLEVESSRKEAMEFDKSRDTIGELQKFIEQSRASFP